MPGQVPGSPQTACPSTAELRTTFDRHDKDNSGALKEEPKGLNNRINQQVEEEIAALEGCPNQA